MTFKFQCWSKSQSLTFEWLLTFHQLIQIFQLSIPCIFGNVLSYVIRSRCCTWDLEIMPQAIRPCTRTKVNDQSSLVNTLILEIFYLWWFDGFTWGIMVKPWSNDEYKLKMLMFTKNIEVWLYVDPSWLFTSYSWLSIFWAIDWAKMWYKTWSLT